MKIYFAGSSDPKSVDMLHSFGVHRFLISYYEVKSKVKRGEEDFYAVHHFTDSDDIMLDSGAWSAYNAGKTVDVNQYAEFLKERPFINNYINLDDIGSGEQSTKNLSILEREGLHPVPVYHYGEDAATLKALADSYNYIGLGGVASIKSQVDEIQFFLARIFDTYPDKRFHIFGMNHAKLLMLYNPYSCDSTTWQNFQRYGQVPGSTNWKRFFAGEKMMEDLKGSNNAGHFNNLDAEGQAQAYFNLLALGVDADAIIKRHEAPEAMKLWARFLIGFETLHEHFTPTLPKQKHLDFGNSDIANFYIPNDIRATLASLMQETGATLDDEILENTPERVYKAYLTMLSGYTMKPEEILSKTFIVDSPGAIRIKGIPFYSLCEHHMLPFFGKVSIEYYPKPGSYNIGGNVYQYKAFGLSKLHRLVQCYSRRLSLQEKLTRQIAEALWKAKVARVKVTISAVHMCVEMRGVESEGETETELRIGYEDDAKGVEYR